MAREFYNTVFSGHAGRDRGHTIKVMQNAIQTDLVFNCFFEDDEEYIFAAGDVVSAFFFDIEDTSVQYQSIGTFTPDIGTNQFTWDRDASDVGTPAAYSLAFKVVSGTAVPDFSIVVDYIVSGVPTGTVVPLPPGNVGVTPAEKAWLGVAVLNGDPALGFNHLGNVLMVDPSFAVGTVGFGVTAFADFTTAFPVAVSGDTIFASGDIDVPSSTDVPDGTTLVVMGGATLSGSGVVATPSAGSVTIINNGNFVGSCYLHIRDGSTANISGSGFIDALSFEASGDFSNVGIFGIKASAAFSTFGAVMGVISGCEFSTISNITMDPANHSNTVNGETFPAVIPQAAKFITLGATYTTLAADGGAIASAAATCAFTCGDGLSDGFQQVIERTGSGVLTIDADTTLQKLTAGTGLETVTSVTVETAVTVTHTGSDVWRVVGDFV